MCHPFHHFIKEICILVCWAILWSFSWAKYFLCLEGEWCWHLLWTAILLVHTASSTFYQHSLIFFDFVFYHQIETALSTDIFCFCDHQPFKALCSHHRMNRIFQLSCTFWQGLFSLDIFRNIFICSLSIFPVIFVTWQSIVFHSHYISTVLTFKSNNSWFWKE